jgi:adenylate cyclase
VLAARIDRLGGRAKDLLGAAAVLGREFNHDLIERVAQMPPADLGRGLARLGEAELIAQTEVYPVTVYAFRHPLTHEVALGALLSDRRRELHRRAALAIAELNADRSGEAAALIAQHYEQAGLVAEACTWYLIAAAWALANDQPAAVAHLDRVRALDHDLPDGVDSDRLRATARGLLLSIGWRVGADLQHMRKLYDQSVAAASRAGDHRLLAQVQIGFVASLVHAGGHLDEVAELSTNALHTARQSGDLGLSAAVQGCGSYVYAFGGRTREALDAAEAVVELTADQPGLSGGLVIESPRGFAQQCRGLILAALGRTSEALVVFDDNDAFLREHGYKENLSWQAYARILAMRLAGTSAAALGLASEAHEIANLVGGPYMRSCAHISLSGAHLGVGQAAQAAQAAEAALALIEEFNTSREHEALARQLRALALVATGDPHQAMAEAERAIHCCVEQGNRTFTPWSCATFATAAAAAGIELDRALQVLNDGERVAVEAGARGFLPEVLDARARLQAARGEHQARRETLQRGLQIARENQAQGWEKRFEDALAGTADAAGRW